MSHYFQTKRLAIGSAEGHNPKPELKDASCGTSQGFFITQDTFTNESDLKSNSNEPVGTRYGNHENRSEIGDSKHQAPKDDDDMSQISTSFNTKPGNDTKINATEKHYSNMLQNDKTPKGINTKLGNNAKVNVTEKNYISNLETDKTLEKSPTRTQKKLPWLVSSRQNTYAANRDENSYVPFLEDEKAPQSGRKRSAVTIRRQSANEIQNAEMNFQRVTQDCYLSEVTLGPQPSQKLGIKFGLVC